MYLACPRTCFGSWYVYVRALIPPLTPPPPLPALPYPLPPPRVLSDLPRFPFSSLYPVSYSLTRVHLNVCLNPFVLPRFFLHLFSCSTCFFPLSVLLSFCCLLSPLADLFPLSTSTLFNFPGLCSSLFSSSLPHLFFRLSLPLFSLVFRFFSAEDDREGECF